jgi:hypothetical protein
MGAVSRLLLKQPLDAVNRLLLRQHLLDAVNRLLLKQRPC